jgi:hypothetical protein
VVPGAQPGISLFDAEAKLLRTWDTRSLGIDTDCASLTYEQSRRLMANGVARQAWINQRQTVSSVLPLPQGIGLVVRRFDGVKTRWDLKLLRLDGTVQTVPVPLEGSNGFFDLFGDFRSGRIVLLLRETAFVSQGAHQPNPPRLIVARLQPP